MSEILNKFEDQDFNPSNSVSPRFGRKMPQEQKERQRETIKEGYDSVRIINVNKGKKMSEEQKEKISINSKFRNLSQESINKRIKSNTGKRRSGIILMIDRHTNEIIKEFEGLTDIDIYFNKKCAPTILQYLKNKSKTKVKTKRI